MTERTRIAITLGDPRGIGPEVTLAALSRFRAHARDVDFVLVGPAGTVADDAAADFESTGRFHAGMPAAEAGRLAGAAIECAARMALDGGIGGMVTAPIEKSALNAAGFAFPGHTEMLAALSGGVSVAMMMAAESTLGGGGALRVTLATTHVALRDVPAALSSELLVEQARITDAGLRAGWGITRPRIALCAVNPHASDNGLFGDEEVTLLAPAIAVLRAAHVDVSGPLPADTVFRRAMGGEFDAVIAPYHDVGMAAFKTAAFGAGVNVTLGLPFVRTSPDHGTAMDIAGTGAADASSMLEAIELAARLVARRAGNLSGAS